MSHEKYIHDNGKSEKSWIDRHRCDICGRLFMNVRYVEAHKNSVHFKQKNFRCGICQKKFAYKKSVVQHTRLFHPGCESMSMHDFQSTYTIMVLHVEIFFSKNYKWRDLHNHNNVRHSSHKIHPRRKATRSIYFDRTFNKVWLESF